MVLEGMRGIPESHPLTPLGRLGAVAGENRGPCSSRTPSRPVPRLCPQGAIADVPQEFPSGSGLNKVSGDQVVDT